MKKSRFFSVLLFVSLLFVLLPATAKAIWEVPVAPGETFRWVFVTSEPTDATSAEIGYYNDLVNDLVAIPATPISGVLGKSTIADIEWKAIASTPTVNAIDNIVVSPASIFTPDGILVATGMTGLFTEGWHDGKILTTELGGTYGGDAPGTWVWTGTDHHGYGLISGSLGGPSASNWLGVGDNYYLASGMWVQAGGQLKTTPYPLYAISEELTVQTVIPAPGAIMLGSIGVGLVGWLRRRRTL